jgi:two-component system sensor histidine kinase/response regulator
MNNVGEAQEDSAGKGLNDKYALLRRYGIATGSTALALLVTWAFSPLYAPIPGLFFLLAVCISAAYGGLGPGLVATAASLFILHSFVLPPTYVVILPITHSMRLGAFGAVASLLSILIAVWRHVAARLHRSNVSLAARVAEHTATLQERLKELTTLHRVARLLQDSRQPISAVLRELTTLLPAAWQYPEQIIIRIRIGEMECATPHFAVTRWHQKATFTTSSGTYGTLEVCYRTQLPHPANNLFMAEEQQLLDSVADLLRLYVDHREREVALRESEGRYRDLFENANDIIYTHDLQGNFTSINRAAERLSGYTRAEALQMHISQVVVPEHLELANQVIARQLAGETLPPYEREILTKDGQRVALELHTRLITREGRPLGIQGIARDITERKRAEEALRQAKEAAEAANRAKSEFLATMSHELRTPLSVILGYTSILLEEGPAYPEAERLEVLRRIDRNAHELLDLITAVLDVSRLEAGRLPVEVKEVKVQELFTQIADDTQELQEQSGLEFVWQVLEPLPLVHTDPGKLKIVLKNLIGNAVKFTIQGRVTIKAAACTNGVEITVDDTGIGISPEAQQVIFEPFQQLDSTPTRQYGGTGLGLYIVKRLLEVLGGKISVTSTPGRGSTFLVWIPTLHTPRSGSAPGR